jgi:hypothetical protein
LSEIKEAGIDARLFAFCFLPTAFCLLASSREAGSWSYQPSMTLAALTAFFS